MVSEKKLAANRLNSQKSTGPKTAEGKARSSRNASTHGIFSRDIVLNGENFEEFTLFREQFIHSLSPQDMIELSLVDRIVTAEWRIRRLRGSEKFLHEVRAAKLQAVAKKERDRLQKLTTSRWPDADYPDEARKHLRAQALAATEGSEEIPATATLAVMCGDADQSFERMSMYEQRLNNEMHRCLRDLDRRQGNQDKRKNLPPSPYLAQMGSQTRNDEEEAVETEEPSLEAAAGDDVSVEESNIENEATVSAQTRNRQSGMGGGMGGGMGASPMSSRMHGRDADAAEEKRGTLRSCSSAGVPAERSEY